MWEVLSFGDKPYGEMSNQEVNLDYFPMPSLIQLFLLILPARPPSPQSLPMIISTPTFGTISCAPFCYFFAILVRDAYR